MSPSETSGKSAPHLPPPKTSLDVIATLGLAYVVAERSDNLGNAVVNAICVVVLAVLAVWVGTKRKQYRPR